MDAVLANWPEEPQKVAKEIISEYGEPDGVTPDRLIWYDNGPWKETTVYRDVVPHHFPMKHSDLLEQVIDFEVPVDKFDDLAEYDGSVIVERTKGTMAARCDKEDMNFLALNLAYDVINGKRSVQEAREFYGETAMTYQKGDKRPYTQRLQFEEPAGETGDPDEAIIEKPTSEDR